MSRLAYIAASSHSGSTLLAMLLGAHPQACTAGELRLANVGDPARYLCSCGSAISQCNFWQRVTSAMHARGATTFSPVNGGTGIVNAPDRYSARLLSPLHRGPFAELARDAALNLSPRWRHHLRAGQRSNALLLDVLHELTGARVIVDSSKLPLRLKYLLPVTGIETKVIRLVRDGRAVALTYTDEGKFADASDPALRHGGNGARHAPPQRNVAQGAREWKRSNESADCLVARLPREQWIQVRYEDLCAQPEATLRQLSEFLGLAPEQVTLNFRAKPQHVIGNGMRLDRTEAIQLDERWREHLSAEELETFNRVAGDLNRRYGYN
jgi:hypothetical protein